MERRDAIREGEKYQASAVRSKREWKRSIRPLNNVGNGKGKKRRSHDEKHHTCQCGAGLKVAKDQVR